MGPSISSGTRPAVVVSAASSQPAAGWPVISLNRSRLGGPVGPGLGEGRGDAVCCGRPREQPADGVAVLLGAGAVVHGVQQVPGRKEHSPAGTARVAVGGEVLAVSGQALSLIHISEPTRLG